MNRPAFLNPAAPTRVILVRHGRSTYNDQGRYQGSSDEAILTPKGRQDAFQTGLALQGISCSALYTSPLHRAQQTAQEILAAFQCSRHSIPVTLHRDLKEVDLPQWAGRRYQDVRETLANDYRCWIERPHEFEMRSPTHELPQRPVPNLYAQAQRFWQQVLPRHAGQTLLVVSHGGTIRALLSTALGIPCRYFHAQQQSNCGISVLNFPHQQPAQLEVMNDTSHLGEVLPKLKAGRQGLRLLLVPDTSAPMPLRSLFDLMEINFSLSQGETAQTLSKELLAHQSQAVQLQTERTDISRVWLQALNNRQISRQAEDGIVTGLWVTKPKMLQEMLSHVVGADKSMREALSLAPGRISVIHYAPSQSLPILQAMNFSDAVLSMRGLRLCAS
ncbi:MAG: histidine phosphatase family protein [Thermosynechococcaceae cyanobacterium]